MSSRESPTPSRGPGSRDGTGKRRSWRRALTPMAMARVAVVARTASLRDALVRVADAGTVEIERPLSSADLPMSPANRALQRLSSGADVVPALSPTAPDIATLEREGRADLLAGEVALAEASAQAVVRGEAAALVGWTPATRLPALAERLAEIGASAAPLRRPKGIEPPTQGTPGPVRHSFAPLVDTYGTVPYADVDPTILAGLAYAVLFGGMFGDVGHGLLIVAFALVIRSGIWRRRWAQRLRPHWIMIFAVGLSATLFGFIYGECFGPTGLVPHGLISPMDQTIELIEIAIGLGASLLAGAYALAIVNRIREGGLGLALYASAGIAGTLVFAGAGMALGGLFWRAGWATIAGAVIAGIGLVLAFIGIVVHAGGGGSGLLQAVIETFDLLVRMFTNVISFARVAGFGLAHAVLTYYVWLATTALWDKGIGGMIGAGAAFLIGNALAFGIEALLSAIQALRLSYYELFSRVFQVEGRPFRPWHVPIAATGGADDGAMAATDRRVHV